jgi:CRISPR/Cas system-associated exonuclease Cas4 (RecB family)
MAESITKFDWLAAHACPAMAWHGLRTVRSMPSEADRFRMEQGQEVGSLARKLYPDGLLALGDNEKSPAQVTKDLMADPSKNTLFEATVVAGPFIAKADILRREDGCWHVIEVKSSFCDTASINGLLSDLAYTVMVFKRAGLSIVRASLLLLSTEYRFGQGPDRLFEIVDVTHDVTGHVAKFDEAADEIANTILDYTPPRPALVSACRDCQFFESKCLGTGIPHTVLEIPGLNHKMLRRLSDERIVDLSQIPNDLGLNDRQTRAREAALSGKLKVDAALRIALAATGWPCHYLDFETVATVLPLYGGHGCHQQVLTQFSVHYRDNINAAPRHTEYLADASRDCQRDLAEALIAALRPEGSILVYSSFEQKRIKALRDAFPDLATPLDEILGRLIDLLRIVTEYVYHPAFKGSYSIKQVLPALVPDLSYKGLSVRDGDTAITRFARMARGEITGADIEVTRRDLLEYCKLDTLAMVRLHQILHTMASQQN